MAGKVTINILQFDNPRFISDIQTRDDLRAAGHKVEAAAFVYTVKKATNTTKVHIGETLSKDRVDDLIDSGDTVNIEAG